MDDINSTETTIRAQAEIAGDLSHARDASRKWLVLTAALLGWGFDGLEMGIFPLIASPALKSFHVNAAHWNGIFTSVFLIGAACGGLVFGWLGDKVGRVRAMTFSVLAYSICTGLGYFSTGPAQLATLRFFAALGMGGEWSLGVALVMEIWPEKRRPILAGIIGAATNVGFALIAIVAMWFVVTPNSWRWVMLVGIIPAALTFFIRLFVPESEKWKSSVRAHGGTARPIREVFSGATLRRTLLGITFASVALIGTWGSVQWIPLWVDRQLAPMHPSAKAVAQLLSSLGAIVGCIIAPLVGDYLGRRITYFIFCLLSLISCGLLFRFSTGYGPMFLFGVTMVGLITASFYGWLPLYLPELFATRVRATGQGVSFNAGRILAAGGAMIAAPLVSVYHGSYAASGATITLVYLIGMIVIWFAPETKGQPLPD